MDLRPGRTSSQISIYDYPEHLNPFYEDENHKRIRFWNIGKKKTNKTGRSNSFSLDGIRDIWTFKSFRSKKNGLRSSTLGINKTSESPPTLRRQIEPSDTNYDTYSAGQRHTVGVGINNNNGNFQRNTGCRASLQDMSKVKEDSDLGFYRNNLYRSSVQGNTTMPGLRKRFEDRTSSAGMKSGSSQSSLNSTNPFDDEEDDNMSISSTVKRPARKKRRAPQPPVTIPKIITTSPTELRINETPTEEQSMELSNLTAEIESFVKISDTETVTPVAKEEKVIVDVPPVIIEVIEPPIEIKVEVQVEVPQPVVATSEVDHPIVVKITETLEPSVAHATIETLVLEESDGDDLEPIKTIDENKTIKTENYEFQIRYVPLKEGTPENDLNGSNSSIPSNSNGRRRSVKDIIASINKSQSLLKINEPKENSSTSISNSSSVDRIAASSESLQKNIKELKENENKIQSFLQEMEKKVDENRNSYYDNIPSTVLSYEPEELNNNKKSDADIVFEKCVLRKKNDDENIDWNPLPKPRRSQRFSTDDNDIVGFLSVKK